MKEASILEEVVYNEDKPTISVLFESKSTKEIRIVFKKSQKLKSHKTPFPIVVEIFQGKIEFGVNGEKKQLTHGSLITLEGNVLHDLTAIEDSIVRLSLSLMDKIERVQAIETGSL